MAVERTADCRALSLFLSEDVCNLEVPSDRPAGVRNCHLSAGAAPPQADARLFSQSRLQHVANSNACLETPHSQRPCCQMLNLPHKKSEDRTAAVTVQNQYVQNSAEPVRAAGVAANAAAKHVDFGNACACLVMERGFIETGTWG